MIFLNIMLFGCLILACTKWFFYYCTMRGLIYYVLEKNDELLDEKDIRQLAILAGTRWIKELFSIV